MSLEPVHEKRKILTLKPKKGTGKVHGPIERSVALFLNLDPDALTPRQKGLVLFQGMCRRKCQQKEWKTLRLQ